MEQPPSSYPGPDSDDFQQLQRRILNLPLEISCCIFDDYLQAEEQEKQVVTIRQCAGESVTGIRHQPAVFKTYYSNGVPRLLHLTKATRSRALQRYSLLFREFGNPDNPGKYFNLTRDTLFLSGVEERLMPSQALGLIRNLAICELPESVLACPSLWGKLIHFRSLQKLTLENWAPRMIQEVHHWRIVHKTIADAWEYVEQVQNTAQKRIASHSPRVILLTDVQMHQIAGIAFGSSH